MLQATDCDMTESTPRPSPASSGDRPASPLHTRVSALVSQILAGGGPRQCALWGTLDPTGSYSSNQPALFPWLCPTESARSSPSSPPLPRSGIVSATTDGRLVLWERPTRACVWPSSGSERMWPTPCVPDGGRTRNVDVSPTGQTADGKKRQIDLGHAVRMTESGHWPTPTAATPLRGAGGTASRGTSLQEASEAHPSQMLNPRWVESLMGFPVGWLTCGRPDGDDSSIPGSLLAWLRARRVARRPPSSRKPS